MNKLGLKKMLTLYLSYDWRKFNYYRQSNLQKIDCSGTDYLCGGHTHVFLDGKKIHFSKVFAGYDVGLRQVEDDVWLVSFIDYDLGCFDLESNKVQALDNPFGRKVLDV